MFYVTYHPYKNQVMCGIIKIMKTRSEQIKDMRMRFLKTFLDEFDRRRQAGFADFPDSLLRTVFDRAGPWYKERTSRFWRADTYRFLTRAWFKEAMWFRNYTVGVDMNDVAYVEKDGFRIEFYSEGVKNGKGQVKRKDNKEEQEREQSEQYDDEEYSFFI